MVYMNNIAFSTLISMSHHLINNVIGNIQKILEACVHYKRVYIIPTHHTL